MPTDKTPSRAATVSLGDIRANAKNPRTITKKKAEMLRRSIREFGDLGGITVTADGTLVGGHQRLDAFRAAKRTEVVVERQHEVPTPAGTTAEGYILVDGERFSYRKTNWDEIKAQAAGLAANHNAGEWSMPDLKSLLGEIKSTDFDISLTMFSTDEIDSLLGAEVLPEEASEQDEAPEPRPEPNVKRGDLYRVGRHFVLCGDSTNITDVRRAMQGQTADAVWTDPPYGVSYTGKTADGLTIQNDGAGGLEELLSGSLANAFAVCRPGAVWYVAAPAGPQSLQFSQVLTNLEVWRQTLVWVKNSLVLGHSDYHYRHEIIYYGWVSGDAHQVPQDRKQDTVLEVPRPTKSKEHPTMKPLALIERCLLHSTREKDVVFEPFGGSGSTMMACEKMGRRCISIELDPSYAQVILDRAKRLFNLDAELVDQAP